MNLTEEMEKAKLSGTVKAVKQVEGFGFISHAETGNDFFFHRSMTGQSPVAWDDIVVDMDCEFIPALNGEGGLLETPKGYRAAKVWVFE